MTGMRSVVALFLLLATGLFVTAAFTTSTVTTVVLLLGGALLQVGAFSAAYARRGAKKSGKH